METNKKYGILFPLRIQGGSTTMVKGVEWVNSRLSILLSWPYYTRFYKPTFGSLYMDLIEEPNDKITLDLFRRFTVDTISIWEPTLTLQKLEIVQEDYKLKAVISYTYPGVEPTTTVINLIENINLWT